MNHFKTYNSFNLFNFSVGRYTYILLINLLLISLLSNGQTKFPTPPSSPQRLFYLQRSNNAHTVIYDANMVNGKVLNADEPVNVYWIRYNEKIHKQDLSILQRKLAYGVETKPSKKEPGNYDMQIVSFKNRTIKVKTNDKGQPMALVTINGVESQLHKIFVQLENDNNMCLNVRFIELFGKDMVSGRSVYERFKP